MNKKLVSILIPTYNRAGFIGESIRSALSQTYKNIEVVVVDNASTDNSWEEIQEISAADSRVRAFRNDTNVGPVRNWIECSTRARGVYSKILWSDDLMAPDYLAQCVPYIEVAEVAFVYSSAKIFRELSGETKENVFYQSLATGIYSSTIFIERSLLGYSLPVSPGCAIFRTVDLRKNLFLNIPNSIGSDFSKHAIGNDLLIYLLTASDYPLFAAVCSPLSLFREHSGSISSKAGTGRLIVHYDITKAFFASQRIQDKKLLAKLNTILLLHRLRYNASQFDIHQIADFYPMPGKHSISIFYILKLIIARGWKALSNLFRRGTISAI